MVEHGIASHGRQNTGRYAQQQGEQNGAQRELNRCREQRQEFIHDGLVRDDGFAQIALQHMANGSSVQTVALNLGYESASSFIAMFKRTLGKPPGQYLAERFAKSLH